MNRWAFTTLVLCLQAALPVVADDLAVRIQDTDGRTHVGVLTARVPGGVHFRADGGTAVVKMPDAYIQKLKYWIPKYDPKALTQLFDSGKYNQGFALCETHLTATLPYIALPSEMGDDYKQWMILAYWSGKYSRALELANGLEHFAGEEKKRLARYYRGLAQLGVGDFQALEKELARPDADQIYPPESAARLYIEAKRLQFQKKPFPAIRATAQLIAKHSGELAWMASADLLCAELYFDLDMPESARSVLEDIREYYPDPEIQKKAAQIAAGK